MSTRALWLLGLSACQPLTVEPSPGCADSALAEGQILVDEVRCRGMRFGESGEGRGADYFMANSQIRAVVRHPQASVSALSLGGGTLVDFAPWGFSDRIHEVLPIVGGGWLNVDSFELDTDGIRIGGVIASLPDRPADRLGERAEVRWRIDPDEPWLHIEGAEGLYVHPAGAFSLLDGQLVDFLTYGTDAAQVEDLGGAVRAIGATRILASRSREAGRWLYPDGRELSGVASGAAWIDVFAESERIGSFSLAETGDFDTRVPAAATHVRARAPGSAPSAPMAIGRDLAVELGEEGVLELQFSGEFDRPVGASWSSSNGAEGWALLPPQGGELRVGHGVATVELTGGPSLVPRQVVADVGGHTTVGVRLTEAFDPGERVIALLDWPADRDRHHRGTDAAFAIQAAADGASWVLLAPEGDVAEAADVPEWDPWIHVEGGSKAISALEYSVTGWPWAPRGTDPAHGAVDSQDFSPADLVTAAHRGPRTDRVIVVDWAWMQANERAPFSLSPAPDYVRLPDAAGLGPVIWQDWFDFLDAGVPLLPAGPYVWVEVESREEASELDIEAGLIRGRVAASTGPVVQLRVNDSGPGEVVQAPARRATIETRGDVDRVALVVDRKIFSIAGSGEDLGTIPLPAGRWAVAAAWSADHWAVTGPVWLDPP